MDRFRQRAVRARRGRGRGGGGFTLFELGVVSVIIGVLAFMLLKRVLFYQAAAERVAAQQVAGALRSALHLQLAYLIVKGRQAEIAGLADQNPMDWLAQKPDNYQGDFYSPAPGTIEPGSWYFDRSDKKLLYVFRNYYFYTDFSKIQLIFRVKLVTMEKGVIKIVNKDRPIEGVILDEVAR